jgi:uncharacterized protein YbjT (DUF2867 family)
LGRALTADGHAVRGTSRDPERAAALPFDSAVADPDRLATLMPAIEGVAVVCWLLGTVDEPALHGPRLASLLEHLVDTPVRGVVYETGGVPRPEALSSVSHARTTYAMPVEVVDVPPAERKDWKDSMTRAVGAVLGPGTNYP